MTRTTLLGLVVALAVLLAVQLAVGFLTEAEPIAAVSPVACPTPVPVATATPDGGPTYTPTLTHTPCLINPTSTPTPTPTPCPTDTLPVGDGCATITPTYTPTPVPPALPDLVALSMSITLETGGDCEFTTKLGVRANFSNVGDADAGPFVVTVNGTEQSYSAGLLQGGSGTLWFNGFDLNENSLFVDSSLQVVEGNELNNVLVQRLAVPTLPPTCTPTATPIVTPTPTKQPDPGDTDGDGCSDQRENGPDETLGGRRDYKNPNDFYDVLGGGAGPPDQIIDLPNDILGVIQHYAPTGTEPEYDVDFDRGPSAGPNVWNMTAPDGVIDLSNDILGVIRQYQHDCR